MRVAGHLGPEDRDARPAHLRLVHREVRVPQQRRAVRAALREDAHPDGTRQEQVAVLRVEGRLERPEDALRDRHGLRLARRRQDQGEFVPADAGERVAAPHHAREAARGLAQHLVAHEVSERVVDGLEVVEVHEQHREGLLVPRGAVDGGLQTPREGRAVREVREGIVLRLVPQTLREAGVQDRDGREVPRLLQHVPVRQRPGRGGVQRERPEHLVARQDRATAAGAQPVRGGELTVVLPRGVGGDVLDHHVLTPRGGRAAGARPVPDGHAVHAGVEPLREARRGARVEPPVTHEHHAAPAVGQLPLHDQRDLLQHGREGLATQGHLQHVVAVPRDLLGGLAGRDVAHGQPDAVLGGRDVQFAPQVEVREVRLQHLRRAGGGGGVQAGVRVGVAQVRQEVPKREARDGRAVRTPQQGERAVVDVRDTPRPVEQQERVRAGIEDAAQASGLPGGVLALREVAGHVARDAHQAGGVRLGDGRDGHGPPRALAVRWGPCERDGPGGARQVRFPQGGARRAPVGFVPPVGPADAEGELARDGVQEAGSAVGRDERDRVGRALHHEAQQEVGHAVVEGSSHVGHGSLAERGGLGALDGSVFSARWTRAPGLRDGPSSG